ncbi:MexH family multidrug efflux RND transporter periplasmic adaptor subunit [Neiella marina]|uniref:MexH family multidrug efflux RND transporter periplasmic adaptor subunit n=1 Tax=Neiella marina TaxID=508461 RepID=A0A8J2XKW1_9GAMM|nr:efflux RND transporter periplasmic adaptor subunit [Neiella marina]GGA64617.1 MexH family multidrug efflux RND transporter periplasmic adaptor subunit [Neiella marina]
MKKWYAWMIVLVIALLGSVIGFNFFKAHMISQYLANSPAPTFPVTVTKVSLQDYVPRISAFGFIEPYRGVTLASEENGTVQSISFESGQQVAQNQVLVVLDLEVEQANLEAALGRMPATERQKDRMIKLFKRGSVSEGEKDSAVAEYLTLKAEIESLKASIDRRTIEAPFDGVVGLRNVYLGQYLQSGDDIVRLEDISTMRIRFTIAQTDLSKVFVGQKIEVDVDSFHETFDGQITAIEPAVAYQSGTVQVQADIPNDNGNLRSGMFARVAIIQPTMTDQILLPQSAINFTLYGESVYVLDRSGGNEGDIRARQTTVKVAGRHGDLALISEGLAAGEEVVVTGQVRLSNGSLVRIVESNALELPAQLPRL